MSWFTVILCISIFLPGLAYVDEDQRPENGAFQYQSSFTGPFGGTHIPFWETGGSAVVMDSFVRLTPNQQSQRGWIWTTRPMRNKDWEIHVQFSVGSDARLGADGMAFWYSKERSQPGPVMGNVDRWKGLAIIIDTFDNDGQRDNPQIYAVYNDHTFTYNPASDGKVKTLGICHANVRQIVSNPENKWAKLLIRLRDRILSVAYDLSSYTGMEPSWVDCFSAEVKIDDQLSGYYLGMSAETGGLSDNHDVKSIVTWSLSNSVNRFAQKGQPTYDRQGQPTYDRDEDENQDTRRIIKDDEPKKERVGTWGEKENKREPIRVQNGEDPSVEIINRIAELEKRDDQFVSTLESKIKEMQSKLESMEKEQAQTLSRLQQGLDSIRSAMDISKLEELKRDVKSSLAALTQVQTRINSIEVQVEGTKQKTTDLHGLHDARSTELKELVERSSSWGFWTYFIIFQVFFLVSFVWWKRAQDDKAKKWM